MPHFLTNATGGRFSTQTLNASPQRVHRVHPPNVMAAPWPPKLSVDSLMNQPRCRIEQQSSLDEIHVEADALSVRVRHIPTRYGSQRSLSEVHPEFSMPSPSLCVDSIDQRCAPQITIDLTSLINDGGIATIKRSALEHSWRTLRGESRGSTAARSRRRWPLAR